MYVWFFLILFGLVIWGFVVLHGQTLWLVGLLLFLLPTAWEIYSLLVWRGFKYQPLDLENEPDVATLWLGDNQVAIGPQAITREPRNSLLRKIVISQALTYFVFGLLSLLAFALSPSKSLPLVSAVAIWNTVVGIFRWLFAWALAPIGVLAIFWAIVLFVATFKWRIVERLEVSRFQRIQRWNQIFYWPALVTVFGTGFASIWAGMARAGVSEPFLYVVYGLGMLVLLVLGVHNIFSSREH